MASFTAPSIDNRYDEYHGTKTHSPYFWHYLKNLYDWREKTGLIPNMRKVDHLITQVDPGKRLAAVEEMLTMHGYDYGASFESELYAYTSLVFPGDPDIPEILIREPKNDYKDTYYFYNQTSQETLGRHARYIGETILVDDITEIYEVLKDADVHFVTDGVIGSKKMGLKFIQCQPSNFTHSSTMYIQYYGERDLSNKQVGSIIQESPETLNRFDQIKQIQKTMGIDKYLGPIDHISTHVMSQDLENTILETVKLAPYFPWGGYFVESNNSSACALRNIYQLPERYCPAKVFTAKNEPSFLTFLSPESHLTPISKDFRNVHHVAFAVPDFGIGEHYLDKILSYLSLVLPEFKPDYVGKENGEIQHTFFPRSELTGWKSEYLQRLNNYKGFFSKNCASKEAIL